MTDELQNEIDRLTAERDQLRAPARSAAEQRHRALLADRDALHSEEERRAARIRKLEPRLASLTERIRKLRLAMLSLE